MAKRAVLYARVAVSSERLGNRRLAEQLKACREYAAAHGLEIVAELAEDRRGASGVKRDRPQLKRAIRMARRGEFDVLIVRDVERLSRDFGQLFALAQELQHHGVQIEPVFRDKREGAFPASKRTKATTVTEEVIVYARVSGDGDTLRHLARQIEALRDYASRYRRRPVAEPFEE